MKKISIIPSGLVFTIILFLRFTTTPLSFTRNGVLGVLYVGVATVTSFYSMTLALGYEDAAVCAIVAAIEIPATYLLEFLVFSRHLTAEAFVGAVLVLFAVVSVSGLKLAKRASFTHELKLN